MSGFDDSAGNLPHYHGHRDRLRGRFRDKGADSLADYELLELALFRALPRRDTKPVAKALLARFGTLADVLSAPPQRLREIDGIGVAARQFSKVLTRSSLLARCSPIMSDRLRRRPANSD